MRKSFVIAFFGLMIWLRAFGFILSGGGGGPASYANDAAHAWDIDNAGGTNVTAGGLQFNSYAIQPPSGQLATMMCPRARISVGDGIFGNFVTLSNDSGSLDLDKSGNVDISGSLGIFGAYSSDNGLVVSDGSGNLTANSFIGDGSHLTGISSGSLPGTVTNYSATVSFGVSNHPVFISTSFDMSNCTAFPFLNGHWTYSYTNGFYTNSAHAGTNFCFEDVNPNGYDVYVFASRPWVTNFPDNQVFLAENSGPPLTFNAAAGDWLLNDFSTPTTAYITNRNVTAGYTNLIVDSGSVRHFTGYANGYPVEQWFDQGSNLLFQVESEDQQPVGFFNNGKVTTYCNGFGIPWTNGEAGFQTFRFNGSLYVPGNTSDLRGQVPVGFTFGNLGQYGANMEWLVRCDSTYSPSGLGAALFCRSIVQDSHGGVQIGNTAMTVNHGMDDDAPAWCEIWGGTTDKPELLLTRSPLFSGTATNGAIQSDGTNLWLTQRGVTQIPLTGPHAQDGSGLTNMAFIKTMTVSGGSVAFSQNADGSSNAAVTVTGGGGGGSSPALIPIQAVYTHTMLDTLFHAYRPDQSGLNNGGGTDFSDTTIHPINYGGPDFCFMDVVATNRVMTNCAYWCNNYASGGAYSGTVYGWAYTNTGYMSTTWKLAGTFVCYQGTGTSGTNSTFSAVLSAGSQMSLVFSNSAATALNQGWHFTLQ